MKTLEDDLREALLSEAATVCPREPLDSGMWPRARRRRHRLLTLTGTAGMLALLGCVVGVTVVAGRPPARATIAAEPPSAMPTLRSGVLGATPAPPATATVLPAPSFSWTPPPDTGACLKPEPASGESPVPALAGVCLPHPVPGFPYRAGPDTETARGVFAPGQRGVPTASFNVSSAPWDVDTGTSGRSVNLEVATVGAFSTSDDGDGKTSQGFPVSAITQARGKIATVVHVDTHVIGLLVSTSRFAILASGAADSAGQPVSIAELVAVVDALQGVD